jgi:hypothetical protein
MKWGVVPRGKLASKNDHCRNLDEAFIVEETTLGTQHFKWGKLVYMCSADIHGANNMWQYNNEKKDNFAQNVKSCYEPVKFNACRVT